MPQGNPLGYLTPEVQAALLSLNSADTMMQHGFGAVPELLAAQIYAGARRPQQPMQNPGQPDDVAAATGGMQPVSNAARRPSQSQSYDMTQYTREELAQINKLYQGNADVINAVSREYQRRQMAETQLRRNQSK